ACLVALVAGLINIVGPKGTARHRLMGRVFVIALIAVCVSSLGIYRRQIFWFPHYDALVGLAVLAIGYLAGRFKRPRKGWLQLHLTAMIFSYYNLVAGGVNEIYLRIGALHRLAPN